MFWKIHYMYTNSSKEQRDIAGAEAEKFRGKVVLKISAETLAPCGTRSSTV